MPDLGSDSVLAHFNPARSALLDRLRPLMGDAMLREIAELTAVLLKRNQTPALPFIYCIAG